jgi:hypothetical protein
MGGGDELVWFREISFVVYFNCRVQMYSYVSFLCSRREMICEMLCRSLAALGWARSSGVLVA